MSSDHFRNVTKKTATCTFFEQVHSQVSCCFHQPIFWALDPLLQDQQEASE
nr:MAG TPA: hypothetical protein [Caudoviricetes sp.]